MNDAYIVKKLLAWYDTHRRILPWRAHAGTQAVAYHVWLSEIMLQQTVVATVIPYFEAFIARWPDFAQLAAADDDAVMAAWAGLGYYARARNMLKAARIIVQDYDGVLPQDEAALLALPGIGPYTSAAIAAIAFNLPAAPVDGNIERVLARLYGLDASPPLLKKHVQAINKRIVPPKRAGDFAQTLMDFGSGLCVPKNPHCTRCPCRSVCKAFAAQRVHELPRRAPKKPKPMRKGGVYWLETPAGAVLMRRRPPSGLLGGMVEFPSYGWDEHNQTRLRDADIAWEKMDAHVKHIFTHFSLELEIYYARAPQNFTPAQEYFWVKKQDFVHMALPSVMQKIMRLMHDRDIAP